MNSTPWLIFCICMFFPAADSALAADYSMDMHNGTLGTGIGFTADLEPRTAIRIGVNSWGTEDYHHTVDDDEGLIFSTPKIEFDNKYIFFDFKPFWGGEKSGGLYLTIGYIDNHNTLRTTSLVETGGQRIGNADAPVGTRLNGTVRYGNSPYSGIRYDFGNNRFFGRLDFGFVAFPAPNVKLEVIDPSGSISEEDIELEKRDMEEELKINSLETLFDVNLNLGIGYRF